MKKKLLTLVLALFAFSFSAFAQSTGGSTRLSPYARHFQRDLEQLGHRVCAKDTLLIQQYSLVRKGCTYYVPAFLTFDHPYINGELKKYGVKVQSAQGNIVTALLSTKKLKKLIDSNAVMYIEINPPAQLNSSQAKGMKIE